jgi:hypothetical protein
MGGLFTANFYWRQFVKHAPFRVTPMTQTINNSQLITLYPRVTTFVDGSVVHVTS